MHPKAQSATALARTWLRRRLRPLCITISAVAAFGGTWAVGPLTPVDGLLADLGTLLRWSLFARHAQPATRTAVVAIDRSTLAAEELKALPRALFGPVWGKSLDTAVQAGAASVTFDIIFEFSGNTVIPNHDRDFLGALARNKARVVIGRTGDTVPALPFTFAIGARSDINAVALSELAPGLDGVVREARAYFAGNDGKRFPTLTAAAMTKAGQSAADEAIIIPTDQPLELQIPTYPLIDVLRCAQTEAGRDLLAQRLGGRAVFVGTTLPEEDRKIAPDRLLLPFLYGQTGVQDSTQVDGCTLNRLGVSAPRSGTVPGVHVHAAAVEAEWNGRALHLPQTWAVAIIAAITAAAAAWAGLALGPLSALATGLAIGAVVLFGSWGLIARDIWLPVGPPILAAILAALLSFAARYWFEGRKRAHLQQVFGHYLSPIIVERLAAAEDGINLAGETRDATIMFADLSGFTALSARLPPAELMDITNRYIGVIVEAVDATGGYVDKYIGDAVMALWNAPAECPDHAAAAIDAAMRAAARIAEMAAAAEAVSGPSFSVKIGLNSGPVVAGNVGAGNRLSYTAVGETVNLASRFEPLPALYGCAVVTSAETARLAAERWLFIEIDQVKVKGCDHPLPVMAPLFPYSAERQRALTPFAEAWDQARKAYVQGDFAKAAALWRSLPPLPDWNGEFGPAAVMAQRCENLLAAPLADWTGIWTVAKG